MRVHVDTERCTGHGRCYTLAPEVYESDDDGYGREIVADVSAGLEEQAEIGRVSCPELAIDITP